MVRKRHFSYLHIVFQPFFINALSLHFIPAPVARKIAPWSYAACLMSCIAMLTQLYPFSWAGQCSPGSSLMWAPAGAPYRAIGTSRGSFPPIRPSQRVAGGLSDLYRHGFCFASRIWLVADHTFSPRHRSPVRLSADGKLERVARRVVPLICRPASANRRAPDPAKTVRRDMALAGKVACSHS